MVFDAEALIVSGSQALDDQSKNRAQCLPGTFCCCWVNSTGASSLLVHKLCA
ncbi:Electron transfer flavoprotein [Pseudomonas syringae pv. actinidiae]|uniref:Electron transfer flavoprotein n=1 Tax=Pseudomonas syringae pv. actinidiae TaxID=103796 RepID=A0A2V0QKW4_PSESF|nr:Electron transfer flavoprotein [Pseudomonas syringae pv. actinidiae]